MCSTPLFVQHIFHISIFSFRTSLKCWPINTQYCNASDFQSIYTFNMYFAVHGAQCQCYSGGACCNNYIGNRGRDAHHSIRDIATHVGLSQALVDSVINTNDNPRTYKKRGRTSLLLKKILRKTILAATTIQTSVVRVKEELCHYCSKPAVSRAIKQSSQLTYEHTLKHLSFVMIMWSID